MKRLETISVKSVKAKYLDSYHIHIAFEKLL
jgi:hypothetical protein